jgi:predicted nucleotidyltransferase
MIKSHGRSPVEIPLAHAQEAMSRELQVFNAVVRVRVPRLQSRRRAGSKNGLNITYENSGGHIQMDRRSRTFVSVAGESG